MSNAHYSNRDRTTITNVLKVLGEFRVRLGMAAFDDYESSCGNWGRCFMARAMGTNYELEEQSPELLVIRALGREAAKARLREDDIAHVVWAFDEAPELLKRACKEYLGGIERDRDAVEKLITETAPVNA